MKWAGHHIDNQRNSIMSVAPTFLVITSSAEWFTLKGGRQEPIGYYLNELVIPVKAALDAGYQMVLATPSGAKPAMDPASAIAAHFGGSDADLAKALDFINTYPAMQ